MVHKQTGIYKYSESAWQLFERGMKQISSNKHSNSEIIEIWCPFIQRPKWQVPMQHGESSAKQVWTKILKHQGGGGEVGWGYRTGVGVIFSTYFYPGDY